MKTTHDEVDASEHVAPREAWDAIAEGYDRYVAPQEAEHLAELGMHPVLAGAEIDRAHRQSRQHVPHLGKAQPVRARWVAVAERAGEIALVGQAEPEGEAPLRRNRGLEGHRGRPPALIGPRAW